MNNAAVKPGQRVRVLQQIDRREGDWVAAFTATVVDLTSQKTGSWFVHGKDDKLWLTRVQLRKENGELTTIVIDRFTRLEMVDGDSTV